MLKTRFIFLKRLYLEYVIIFKINRKLYVYGYDLKIIRYFKLNNIINTLNKYGVNYIIIDNLNIVVKKEFNYNKYLELLYKSILIYLIEKGD